MIQHIGPWRVRRALLLICAALIVLSIVLFLSVQVSEVHGGTIELLNGQADTSALALPLALFIIGAIGLLAALGWHPEQ